MGVCLLSIPMCQYPFELLETFAFAANEAHRYFRETKSVIFHALQHFEEAASLVILGG
jgi:hypothetical protein